MDGVCKKSDLIRSLAGVWIGARGRARVCVSTCMGSRRSSVVGAAWVEGWWSGVGISVAMGAFACEWRDHFVFLLGMLVGEI